MFSEGPLEGLFLQDDVQRLEVQADPGRHLETKAFGRSAGKDLGKDSG